MKRYIPAITFALAVALVWIGAKHREPKAGHGKPPQFSQTK